MRRCLPRQLPVRDSARAGRGIAEGLAAPVLVLGGVAIEEGELAIAHEAEEARGERSGE